MDESRILPLPSTLMKSPSLGAGADIQDYVVSLDGIRGISISIVLLSHAAVPGFHEAGGIGVDIFFVLSGYLITTVLIREYERPGQFPSPNSTDAGHCASFRRCFSCPLCSFAAQLSFCPTSPRGCAKRWKPFCMCQTGAVPSISERPISLAILGRSELKSSSMFYGRFCLLASWGFLADACGLSRRHWRSQPLQLFGE